MLEYDRINYKDGTYFFEDTEIKTTYTYDALNFPDFTNADLVPSIILDINGNIVE